AGEDPRENTSYRWTCWMLLGEFERAWHESDLSGSSIRGQHPFASRHVLIRCLRGLGDAIQFLRYTPALKKRCARVSVQAPAHLIPLLERIRGIDDALPLEHLLTGLNHESEIECSDLPYVFRTTSIDIPAE